MVNSVLDYVPSRRFCSEFLIMERSSPSIWERIVYGADREEQPQRSASISSSGPSPNDAKTLEKDIDAIRATEREIAPESPTTTKKIDRPTWRPTVFQPRALAGVGSLCVAVLCIFVSLAILVASHGQPVDNWPIWPTVYLAIVAAISNSAVRLGHFHSVPISWWHHASKGGSIRTLERHWEINNSVAREIYHSRHLSVLNLACIAVSLAVIDGPFLQRASTVILTRQTTNVTLSLPLPAELPAGFSGYYQYQVLNINAESNATVVEHLHHEPIHLNVPSCEGQVR